MRKTKADKEPANLTYAQFCIRFVMFMTVRIHLGLNVLDWIERIKWNKWIDQLYVILHSNEMKLNKYLCIECVDRGSNMLIHVLFRQSVSYSKYSWLHIKSNFEFQEPLPLYASYFSFFRRVGRVIVYACECFRM